MIMQPEQELWCITAAAGDKAWGEALLHREFALIGATCIVDAASTQLPATAFPQLKPPLLQTLAQLGELREEQSLHLFPLCFQQRLIGVLALIHQADLPISGTLLQLLEQMSGRLAMLIDYLHWRRREREWAQVVTAMTTIGREVAVMPDLARILQLVMDKAAETIPMDAGVIFILDEVAQRYRVAVAHNLPATDVPQITFAQREGVPGWVVFHRQALIVADARQDPRVHPYVVAGGICSVMAVPLIVHERVVGVLNFFARRPNAFHENELRVAQMYADQAAIFVHNTGLMDELRTARDKLEQRVEERTRQLRETQAQALRAEKFAVAGRLAAALAHEINNPLQAILLHLQAIEAGGAPQTADAVTIIEHELTRIAGIVRRLLDVQSPKGGRFGWQQVDHLIDELLTLLAAQLRSAQVQVTWACPAPLPPIWADGDQLKQLFLNLILNALDAMPDEGTLQIRATVIGTELVIAFTDNGMGMEAATLAQIFEPFFSTKGSGTGLGLPVSLEIATAHGGTITAHSKPNAGTTFAVTLPAARVGF
jgi:signal transduction histidine kinase